MQYIKKSNNIHATHAIHKQGMHNSTKPIPYIKEISRGHPSHAYSSKYLMNLKKPMQKIMFYRRSRRSRSRRRILDFSGQRQKSNLSHADTQLRLARTHERNEYDFPVGGRPKEDAQTPNLRHIRIHIHVHIHIPVRPPFG